MPAFISFLVNYSEYFQVQRPQIQSKIICLTPNVLYLMRPCRRSTLKNSERDIFRRDLRFQLEK